MTITRREFVNLGGLAAVGSAIGSAMLSPAALLAQQDIAGFDQTKTNIDTASVWQPVSDRKIRMGLVGYGLCRFAAQFGFQNHPNVDVVGVSDLIPERCARLSQVTRCPKTFTSLEEMLRDDSIEAVFVATDAPSHARHCIDTLKRGKHVAVAVPAVFGNSEEADELYEAVKSSGRQYMMFETSAYHDEVHAARVIYEAGGFGKMIYTEGEYYHFGVESLDSYKGWRIGLPPQFYPTHSNAYYVMVTGGSFTDVSCMGNQSVLHHLRPENNRYRNGFGTETALMRTSEGGMARMIVSWDTPGTGGETGRSCGEKGAYWSSFSGLHDATALVKTLNLRKPALPPGVDAGGHGGSHGYLGNEFVMAILEERKPLIDIAKSLNMTVAGIVSHQSALKDGERLKIPQYTF